MLGVSVGVWGQQPSESLLVYDSFNRANSTTTLGNAETGQTWSVPTGTMGILSNAAYIPAGTNTVAGYIQTGAADESVSSLITWVTGNEAAVFFRSASLVSANDCIEAILRSTGLQLRKRVGAALTNIGTLYSFTPVSGTAYRITLEGRGSTIRGYVDGVERASATETAGQTNTIAGIWVFRSAAIPQVTFDDFSAAR